MRITKRNIIKVSPQKAIFRKREFSKIFRISKSFDNLTLIFRSRDSTEHFGISFWIILNHLGSFWRRKKTRRTFFNFFQVPISPVKDLHFSFLVPKFSNFKNFEILEKKIFEMKDGRLCGLF